MHSKLNRVVNVPCYLLLVVHLECEVNVASRLAGICRIASSQFDYHNSGVLQLVNAGILCSPSGGGSINHYLSFSCSLKTGLGGISICKGNNIQGSSSENILIQAKQNVLIGVIIVNGLDVLCFDGSSKLK